MCIDLAFSWAPTDGAARLRVRRAHFGRRIARAWSRACSAFAARWKRLLAEMLAGVLNMCIGSILGARSSLPAPFRVRVRRVRAAHALTARRVCVFAAGWRLWRAGPVTITLGIDSARRSIVIGAKLDDLYAVPARPVGAVRGTAAHRPCTRRRAPGAGGRPPPPPPRANGACGGRGEVVDFGADHDG